MNNRIEINPKIMVGKPVIRGTRITVEHILNLIAEGRQIDDILVEYPRLKKLDILAAVRYAKERISEEQVYPLSRAIA